MAVKPPDRLKGVFTPVQSNVQDRTRTITHLFNINSNLCIFQLHLNNSPPVEKPHILHLKNYQFSLIPSKCKRKGKIVGPLNNSPMVRTNTFSYLGSIAVEEGKRIQNLCNTQ